MKIIQKERRRPTCLWYLDKTKEWEFQSFSVTLLWWDFAWKIPHPLDTDGSVMPVGFPWNGVVESSNCAAHFTNSKRSQGSAQLSRVLPKSRSLLCRETRLHRWSKHNYQPIRARVRFRLVYVFSCEFSRALVNQSYQCVFPKCDKGSSE